MSTSSQTLQDPLQQQTLAPPEPVDAGLEDPLADSLSEPLGDPLHGTLQLASAGPPGGAAPSDGGGDPTGFHDIAVSGISGSGGQLPHLDTIQSSFGHHDVTGLTAHTDSAAQSASMDLNARGFALGSDVALGKTDLFTTAHEAAHGVQQEAGISLKDDMGSVGDRHEQHADAVATKVVNGESAEGLLDQYTGGQPSQVGGMGAGVQMLQRDGGPLQEDDTTAMVEDTAHQLGEVDSMGGMMSVVGGMLDALAPGPGDKRKVGFKVEVACSPVVKVAYNFASEIARTDGGKLKVKTNVEFGAKATADLWVAEAVVAASIGGYLEAQGGNGAAIMDMVGLAIQQAIASVSQSAADYVFGEGYDSSVRDDMDDDDYIESGITAGVAAGVSASGGIGDSVSSKVSAGATAKGKLGTRHTKSGSETVSDTSLSASAKAVVSASGTLPGTDWKGTGTLTAESKTGGAGYGQFEVGVTRQADMQAFTTALKSGNFEEHLILWLTGAVSLISGVAGEHMGMDCGGERNLGRLLGDIGGVSLSASVGSSGLLDSIHDKLGTTSGTEMKQALGIKVKWSGGKATLDMDLSRASKLKISTNIKAATIEVLIENMMRLVKIPTVTF